MEQLQSLTAQVSHLTSLTSAMPQWVLADVYMDIAASTTAIKRGYMSRIVSVECKCAICGATNVYRGLASTNISGGPDLDLRPAEMKRSTMHIWIQECPECGYISKEVSDPSDVTREWLLSEKYLTCDEILFESELAKQFYKYYLISLEDKNPENALFAVLHAAWACDDKNDDINSKHCRELAISLATKLIESNYDNKENIMLMRADLMRRAGQFETMIDAYASVQFDEELLNQILRFEVEKAKEKNTACYRVADVTGKE